MSSHFARFINRFSVVCGKMTFVLCGFVATMASECAYGEHYTARRTTQYIISQEYGLNAMTVTLPSGEISAQSARATVSFSKALRKALESIMSDASNPTSPLALALFEVAADPDKPDTLEATARQWHDATRLLYSHLNRAATRLRLLGRNEHAARGENPVSNWTFELRVPELSDQPFYIIVDRQGAKATYTYGVGI